VKAEGEQGGGLPAQPAGETNARLLAKADLAHELNQEISKIGRSLLGTTEASEELTFYCECGCLNKVELSLAAFDAVDGALLDGHSRPQGAS
jgi:hypothetical protein